MLMLHHLSNATSTPCSSCLTASEPCQPIYVETRCPTPGPSRWLKLPNETLGKTKAGGRLKKAEEGMEGKLTLEYEVGGRWGWGKQAQKKKNRQNRKINEVLFQWQDLCTVNITLAIRGNPITLCLSFLSGREERKKQKNERWKETDRERERERTLLHDSSTFQLYSGIQETKQVKKSRMN